ncbi:MAG: aldo/keto reductase, partial [Flavobacteriales bacterium]
KTVEKLNKIADGLGLSLPVMALAWCLKNPNVSTVILGASKEAQLKENLKASEAQDLLTPAVMEKIEKMLGNAPVRPQW